MKKILIFLFLSIYSWNIKTLADGGSAAAGAAAGAGATYLYMRHQATQAAAQQAEAAAANAAQEEAFRDSCGWTCVGIWVAAGLQVISLLTRDRPKTKEIEDLTRCTGALCNDNGGNTRPPGTPDMPDPYTYQPDPNDPMAPLVRRAQEDLRTARDMGIEYDEKTNTYKTPKGTMSGSQFASAYGGNLSDEQMNKINQEAAQIQAALEKKFLAGEIGDGSSETGGGKKRNAGGDGGGSGFDMNAYLRSLNRNGDGKRGVAGLSVRAGTDNVGVKESNIFEQASAAYNKDQVLNRGNP